MCYIIYMDAINTNNNVPAEQVRGQSIAGPETAPQQPEENTETQAAADQKGTQVDTSA